LPKSDRIEIAVPGTIMKLNPTLFETLRRIRDTALRPCHFTFFTGFAHGLAFAELSKQITLVLPDATVNPNLYYQKYCEELAKCEFTLNPFPYGNMNTVMESVALGLPGVCLDGAESHAHTDGAIYARLGLPACLNTQSIDDYVTQAVRLIDDGDWLAHCRDLATRAPFDAKFYEGDESLFCDAVYNLIPST
jgi:hypothetical protein